MMLIKIELILKKENQMKKIYNKSIIMKVLMMILMNIKVIKLKGGADKEKDFNDL